MNHLLFYVFVVILCVHCTFSDTIPTRELLDTLDFRENSTEMDFNEIKIALIATARRIIRLEYTIMEASVIDRMRRLLHRFPDHFFSRNKNISDEYEKIKSPPRTAIPNRLSRARDEAKTTPELNDAKKRIRNFKYVYRRLMAILENVRDSEEANFAAFKNSLHESGLRSNEAMALAGAELYSEVHDKVSNNKEPRMEINWNEEGLISALKYWHIDAENVISFATALHNYFQEKYE